MCKLLNNQQVDFLEKLCENFNFDSSELINILHKAQEHFGFLPQNVQQEIARNLNIPVSKVYGVVTFYSLFTMTPKGKFPISICTGTACYVRGADDIVSEFERQLKIKVGQTTPDGMFSLGCLRCVGACGLAPVVMVGEKIYGKVTPGIVKDIIEEYNG